MTKQYITQEQLNTCLAEFFTKHNDAFDTFFIKWAYDNIDQRVFKTVRVINTNTVLTTAQNQFVANVLTIFNNI